jgi:hypothetical protein
MGQQIAQALRQSTHRAVDILVSFLPGLAAFIVAVLVLGLIGVLLAMLVRRVLTALHFDERLGSGTNAFSEWLPSQSPTLVASRATLWFCLFAGIAIGITAFGESQSANSQVPAVLLPYLTHTIGAILLLIVGNLIARFLARTVLIGAVNAQLQYARFLALGIKWLVLVLTAAMALDHLGIGGAVVELAFGILFGGIVLTLALAIGLGSRDLVTRSIERTMEKPSTPAVPTAVSSIDDAEPPRAKLRHF